MSKRKAEKKPGKGKQGLRSGSSPMDVGMLEEIVKLMSANDLNTVEVRDGDKRVVLKRGVVAPSASSGIVYAHAPNPGGSSGAPSAPPPSATASIPASVDETAGLTPIKSPMVGTFYTASSPDAKPFVQVGSTVDEETDVCIIEAMKVFNNIKAECRGTIAKILVNNGQTVEFGQTLFLVKP